MGEAVWEMVGVKVKEPGVTDDALTVDVHVVVGVGAEGLCEGVRERVTDREVEADRVKEGRWVSVGVQDRLYVGVADTETVWMGLEEGEGDGLWLRADGVREGVPLRLGVLVPVPDGAVRLVDSEQETDRVALPEEDQVVVGTALSVAVREVLQLWVAVQEREAEAVGGEGLGVRVGVEVPEPVGREGLRVRELEVLAEAVHVGVWLEEGEGLLVAVGGECEGERDSEGVPEGVGDAEGGVAVLVREGGEKVRLCVGVYERERDKVPVPRSVGVGVTEGEGLQLRLRDRDRVPPRVPVPLQLTVGLLVEEGEGVGAEGVGESEPGEGVRKREGEREGEWEAESVRGREGEGLGDGLRLGEGDHVAWVMELSVPEIDGEQVEGVGLGDRGDGVGLGEAELLGVGVGLSL